MYDNFNKLFNQYDFGFALFKITMKELRLKTASYTRKIKTVYASKQRLAEDYFILEPGRYSVVPFCMQTGEAIFLYMDVYTDCHPLKLEF